MIDAHLEHLLTLSAAARSLPGRSGRGVHVSTIWRWSQRGIRGVRLETILVGGTRHTSREALQRFFTATTAAADGTPPATRTPHQRRQAAQRAERELGEAGI